MACLDTDFLIELLKGNSAAKKKSEELTATNEPLFITPLIAIELYRGIVKRANESVTEKMNELIDSLVILEFDKISCKKAAELIEWQKKAGNPIGDFDTLTAALAIRFNEKIVTKNIKHFGQFKELKVDEW